MPTNATTTSAPFRALVLTTIVALTLQWLACARPPAALAADGWKFGEYTDFTPATVRSLQSPSAPLKLSRTAVQRPRVFAGESVDLIAEYDVSVPSGTMMVKETRIVYFNGQQLDRKERVVSVPSGPKGSKLVLHVPASAAAGWYAVRTTIEPQSGVATRGPAPAATPDTDQTTFNVEKRSDKPPGQAPLQFKLWTDKTEYKIGESVKIGFESRRDGYVTIVNVGTSGRITILYPNAYAPDHAVKAGRSYSLPAAGDPWELTLGGPDGTELIYAVFTTTDIRFAESNFAQSAFTVVNEDAVVRTRDMNVKLKTIPLKEQADATVDINVLK